MIIEAKNLVKSYGKKVVIKYLNLNIQKNTVYGLLGENGAGKTTLLSMICGLVKQDSGEIKINGYDNEKDFNKVKGLIGASLQNSGFYEHRTGLDNLLFYAKLRGITDEEEIMEIVDRVGLKENINKKVEDYSNGMVKLLEIAQALIGDPEILILDEPTAGFDPKVIHNIGLLIKSLKNKTIILSSHNTEIVKKTCSHIGIIKEGKFVLQKRLPKGKNLEKLFIKAVK